MLLNNNKKIIINYMDLQMFLVKKGAVVFMEILVQMNMYAMIGKIDLKFQKKMDGNNENT